MTDKLCLNINVKGENIMGNPLLKVHGIAKIGRKYQEIDIETPVTSVEEFILAFRDLFEAES
jgi:hypothetical protein